MLYFYYKIILGKNYIKIIINIIPMNQENFNKQFPSWENLYNKLQNEEKKNKDEKQKQLRMTEFSKAYPILSFNDLKIQNNYYSTDDGCIHYKNVIDNQIYSWSYIENEWEEHSVNDQNELSDLFTT
jgi:hypothetical protein